MDSEVKCSHLSLFEKQLLALALGKCTACEQEFDKFSFPFIIHTVHDRKYFGFENYSFPLHEDCTAEKKLEDDWLALVQSQKEEDNKDYAFNRFEAIEAKWYPPESFQHSVVVNIKTALPNFFSAVTSNAEVPTDKCSLTEWEVVLLNRLWNECPDCEKPVIEHTTTGPCRTTDTYTKQLYAFNLGFVNDTLAADYFKVPISLVLKEIMMFKFPNIYNILRDSDSGVEKQGIAGDESDLRIQIEKLLAENEQLRKEKSNVEKKLVQAKSEAAHATARLVTISKEVRELKKQSLSLNVGTMEDKKQVKKNTDSNSVESDEGILNFEWSVFKENFAEIHQKTEHLIQSTMFTRNSSIMRANNAKILLASETAEEVKDSVVTALKAGSDKIVATTAELFTTSSTVQTEDCSQEAKDSKLLG